MASRYFRLQRLGLCLWIPNSNSQSRPSHLHRSCVYLLFFFFNFLPLCFVLFRGEWVSTFWYNLSNFELRMTILLGELQSIFHRVYIEFPSAWPCLRRCSQLSNFPMAAYPIGFRTFLCMFLMIIILSHVLKIITSQSSIISHFTP